MSAWSDWQCGAITYEEYKFACMREAALDEMEYNELFDEEDNDNEGTDD